MIENPNIKSNTVIQKDKERYIHDTDQYTIKKWKHEQIRMNTSLGLTDINDTLSCTCFCTFGE